MALSRADNGPGQKRPDRQSESLPKSGSGLPSLIRFQKQALWGQAMKFPNRIDLDQKQIDALLQRVKNQKLEQGDYEIIKGLIDTLKLLGQAVGEKSASIKRLLRMIFGESSEKKKDLIQNEQTAIQIFPALDELIRQAAQGEIVHNDDTTMKIQQLIKENQEKSPDRTGMFTSGIVSVRDGRQIAIFATGRQHAGENLEDLLTKRDQDLPPPIHMCDALSRNIPKSLQTLLAHCLTHGRRNFVDVLDNFPEECQHVIEQLALVYKNDELAKEQEMSAQERLEFHQQESGPIMEELQAWCSAQLEKKIVEPNSGLGKAISYMLKHWMPLTLFLRVPRAPLDNNICERILKKSILHRKNSLFYRTLHGARIGDLFMSLIHTCNLNRANPFDYLTELQKNCKEMRDAPQNWMPWNYKKNILNR